MDIEIRQCKEDDLASVGEFYDEVTHQLCHSINYPRWTHKSYPSIHSAAVEIAHGAQFACVENGQIVGAFVLNENPQGDYACGDWKRPLADGEYLVIHALAVSPAHRGRGIAQDMVRFCVERAAKLGYKSVRVDVVPDNYPARGLYEKLGFEFAGERDLKRGIDFIPTFVLYEKNL